MSIRLKFETTSWMLFCEHIYQKYLLFLIQDDNQFTKEKRSQSNLSRTNKSGGTLRRVAFKDVPPCDSSSEDICTCSSNNSQQG